MSPWMSISPATYVLDGIREAILDGAGLSTMWDEIWPLLVIGAFCARSSAACESNEPGEQARSPRGRVPLRAARRRARLDDRELCQGRSLTPRSSSATTVAIRSARSDGCASSRRSSVDRPCGRTAPARPRTRRRQATRRGRRQGRGRDPAAAAPPARARRSRGRRLLGGSTAGCAVDALRLT